MFNLPIHDIQGNVSCVISTKKGTEGIKIKDKENIIIEDNTGNFTKQIINILKNNKKRKKIGNNAYKLIKNIYIYMI